MSQSPIPVQTIDYFHQTETVMPRILRIVAWASVAQGGMSLLSVIARTYLMAGRGGGTPSVIWLINSLAFETASLSSPFLIVGGLIVINNGFSLGRKWLMWAQLVTLIGAILSAALYAISLYGFANIFGVLRGAVYPLMIYIILRLPPVREFCNQSQLK